MEKITIVGVDLTKNVFQLHAADREDTLETEGSDLGRRPEETAILS